MGMYDDILGAGQSTGGAYDDILGGTKPKKQDNPLVRGLTQANSARKTFGALATGDYEQAAKLAAERDAYQRANPGSPEGNELMAAWEKGDGIVGGIKGVAGEIAKDWREAPTGIAALQATGKNLAAMGGGIVEQVPNMIMPMAGMLAGGAAGSLAGPAGTVAGAFAGAATGNTAAESSEQVDRAIRGAGIDPQNTQAVRSFLEQDAGGILGKSAIKGGIIGAVDTATMGIGGRVLNAPARAATDRAIASLGIDAADKAAVSAARQQIGEKVLADPIYQASQKGAQAITRNLGVAALEPTGEFAGEYLGQGVATGDWDTKGAMLEALSSLGQSGITYAGQKIYQYATNPARGLNEKEPQETAPTVPDGVSLTADPSATKQRIDAMLGLDTARMDEKGRALYQQDLAAAFNEPIGIRIDADQNEVPYTVGEYLDSTVKSANAKQEATSRLSQLADEEAQQHAAITQDLVQSAAQGGALSKAALTGIQTGATQMPVHPERAAIEQQMLADEAAQAELTPIQRLMRNSPADRVQRIADNEKAPQTWRNAAVADLQRRVATQAQPTTTSPLQQTATQFNLPEDIRAAQPVQMAQAPQETNAPQDGIEQGTAPQRAKVKSDSSLNRDSSWVIRNKETGEVVMETFDRKKVDALNTSKYEAVPIQEYLGSLNVQSAPNAAPIPNADAGIGVGGITRKRSIENWTADELQARLNRADAGESPLQPESRQKIEAELAKRPARKAPINHGLSVGKAPNSAAPVTVRNGVIFIGDEPAVNYDTEQDITIANDATPRQIVDALKSAGAIATSQRFYGLPAEPKAEKQKTDRRQIDATKDTLFQAIAKLGGMDTQELTSNGFDPKDITYETAAKVSKKTGKLGKKSRLPLSFGFNMPLHKKGGMSFDGVLEELKQHGYFPEDATKNDAIEAFRRELGGDAVMTPDAAMQQAEMQAEQEANDAIGYDDLSDREKALVDFHAENIYDEDNQIEAFKRGMKRDGATEDEINEAIKQTFGAQETGNNDSGGTPQGTGETRDAQGADDGRQDGEVQEGAEPDWLTGQTNEQAAAELARQQAAKDKEAADKKAAEDKAKADAEANDFRLAGSDRAADVAVAGGQHDIFAQAPKPERGEVGASLTKAERSATLKTLIDVYRKNRAPKEFKGLDSNGNERYGYAHSPEFFVKSDITGSMVRYYVTLPDGRVAHPTELFSDYTQANIDAALQKEIDAEREQERNNNSERERLLSLTAPTINEANGKFNNAQRFAEDRDSIVPALLTNGELYLRSRPENADKAASLLGEGWRVEAQQEVKPAPAKYAGPADVSSRSGQMELANRAGTIATLKAMNEQLRKIAPDEAWADSNIDDAQNLDALRDQISQALVDANRGKPDVNPLRKELEELSGQELKDVFSKLNLAGKLMAYEERISALLMEDAAEVRAAISAVTGNPSESTAQPVKATTEAKAVEPAAVDAKKEAKSEVIEGAGEKLEFARKYKVASMAKEYSDQELANLPLSKIWPADEIDSIEDAFIAAVSTAARAEIPAKPRKVYKVDSWVNKIKALRGLVQKVINSTETRDRLREMLKNWKTLDDFYSKVVLLESIDRAQWKRIGYVRERPDAYQYKDGNRVDTPMVSLEIDGKSHWIDNAGSVHDALDKINKLLGVETKPKLMEFEVRGKGNSYFINKKGDREYRKLKTFTSTEEAFKFRKENYDELVSAWEAVKDSDNVKKTDVRNAENRPRTGQDWRKGKNVDSQTFIDTFGFRAADFGNWVKQGDDAKERQGMLNQAYDALMDLSEIVGLPPKAISLNGTLALGFGLDGKGWASAHFSPDKLFINLTKTRGAGSIAHEWLHALDNYFARMRNDGNEVQFTGDQNAYRKDNFVTYKPEAMYVHKTKRSTPMSRADLQRMHEQAPSSEYWITDNWEKDKNHPEGIRPQVEKAFSELVETLNASPMLARARKIDKGPDGYWSRIIERGARSFENYVIHKMMEGGYQNDYLANVKSAEDFSRDKGRYPYLLPEEVAPVAEAFDNLFNTLETKETDKGIALMEESAVYNVNEPDAFTGDIFQGTEHALPETKRRAIPAGRQSRARADDGQGASRVLAVREAADTPGVYHVSAQLVTVGERQLPVATVKTSEDAARAFAHLSRFAVEHMDGLVTDKDGKPLAIIGAFKGAPTQASVYSSTLMMELARIDGAANLWLSHNHPSGMPNLSEADRTLSRNFRKILRDTSVTYQGLSAMARRGDTIRWEDDDYNSGEVSANEPTPHRVPIVERELVNSNPVSKVGGPQDAKRLVPDLAKDSPGVVFLTAQNEIASFVPFSPEEMGELRSGSRLMKLFNAAAKSGATGALVAMPDGKVTTAQFGNLKGALGTIDVGVFDGIRYDSAATDGGKSVAESGEYVDSVGANFFSRGNGATQGQSFPRAQAESRIKSILGDKLGKVLIDSGIVTFTNKGNEYQGATYKDGSIVLNLDALSADNFDGVLLHEGMHSTIRDIVGEATYAKLMKQLENMHAMGKGAQWVKDANAAIPSDTKADHRTEELAAYAIEQYVNGAKQPNVITRWVESLLSALRTAIIRRLPFGKLKSWAVNNLQPQDLANLAIAGLKAKARGQLQAQGREAMAYSNNENLNRNGEVFYTQIYGNEIGRSSGKTIQEKASNWMRENLQGKSFKNYSTGWDISIGRKGINKSMMHSSKDVHARSVTAIPSMLNNAVLVYSEQNNNEKERESVPLVHHFYAPLIVGNREYIARMVVKEATDGHRFYDYDTSDEISPAVNDTTLPFSQRMGAASGARLTMSMDKLLSHVKKEHGGTDSKFSKINQTDTPAFKKWFGDSKVVDADGKPLVVYHGTNADFSVFKTTRMGEFGPAIYLTDNPREAGEYGEAVKGISFAPPSANIMPVYARIENPYTKGVDAFWKEFGRSDSDAAGVERAKAAGYDGIIAKRADRYYDNVAHEFVDLGNTLTHYIAFSNTQVKSAIGNNGDFGTNPDIRYSRAKIIGDSGRQYDQTQRQFFKNVGRDIDKKNLVERTTEYLKNDFWKKMAVGIVDQFRGLRDLGDNGQAYMLARLSKGTAGAFDALLHHGKLSIRDGVYDADTSGGFIDRLGTPLHGELDDFLWYVAANRAEGLSRVDRENLFTPADIAAGKSLARGQTNFDYTIQTGPQQGTTTRNRTLIYADANRVFNEFQKNTLDMAEQSGLIDGASRKLWESEFYVPFYRVSEEDGEFIGAKMGNALVRQQAFKKLKGGTDKLNSDLLSNTLLNFSHLIEASAKNRAAKASLAAAEKVGVADRVAPDMAGYMASNGAMLPPGTKGTVWFQENGKKVEYKVSDPFVMTAITSLEYAGMRNGVMDVMTKFKHWLTIGVTASPAFKVRNLIRDSIQSIGASDLSYNPIKNIAEGYKQTKRDSQEYVSALASGGLIRFGTMLEGSESSRVRQLVKSGVKDSTILNSENKWRAFYDQYLDPAVSAYNELGNRSEEINRAALYNQLIKQGKSHAEAALLARDLMDFSMQGSFNTVRFLTQVVPFMNARLQGMYKLGRAAKDNPRKMAVVTGAVALASIALMLAYGDDDDWKRREDWDRDGFWWFKLGGVEFRIPKPFEVGAIGSLAERSLELMIDDEMTGERFRRVVNSLVMNNLSMNPIPQAFKPILDLYANKDSFTGRPIESMGMQRLDPTERFNSNTSMIARGMSNASFGALSPVQIDHLARAYFGWLGSFVIGGADMAFRSMSDQPTKPALDYFKFGTQGILKEAGTGSSRYVTQVYEQAKELEQAHATYRQMIKDGRIDEAKDYAADNQDKMIRYRQVEAVKKVESNLNERIRKIERSDMDSAEKKDAIALINKQKEQVAKRIAAGAS